MTETNKQDQVSLVRPMNARDDPEWWAERNARRRQHYAESKEYRESRKAMSRANYRASTEAPSVVSFDPRENLPKMDNFGASRECTFPDGRVVDRWCLTIAETAEVFGKTPKLFYSWIRDGRFPAPVITALTFPVTRDYKRKKGVQVPSHAKVFASEEVVAAVKALGPHLASVAYYRADHTNERDTVHRAVQGVRNQLGISQPSENG